MTTEPESAVLGAVLVDRTALAAAIEEGRHESDFSSESDSLVWATILAMATKGIPVDLVTVSDELERLKILERVDGRTRLALLTDALPDVANTGYYALLVRTHAASRRVATAALTVAEAPEDVAALARLDRARETQRQLKCEPLRLGPRL